jgi:xylose isomerase
MSESSKEFFPDVSKIEYKPESKGDALSFKHYNPDEFILGKPMKEWLRFSVCFWHTFVGGGGKFTMLLVYFLFLHEVLLY